MSILEKFTVVDLIKTRSESVVTIQGNTLKFNRQTAVELHFASHIIRRPSSLPSVSARQMLPMPFLSPSRKGSRSTKSALLLPPLLT